MTTDQKIQMILENYTPSQLPVGFYVVSKEGTFIKCNEKLKSILEVSIKEKLRENIIDFYQFPKMRDKIQNKAEKMEENGECLEQEILPFKTKKGKEIFVEDFCRIIRNPENNDIIGYCGCIIDVTKQERYHRLFDHLPTGVYQLDNKGIVLRVNNSVVEMLGYDSKSEIENKHINNFYAEPEKEIEYNIEIQESKKMVNQKVELVKKNKEKIWVTSYSHEVTLSDGSYGGREGTMTDVTSKVLYDTIMNEVPVAFYTLKVNKDKDIIEHCNKQFNRLFDFDEKEDLKYFNIRQLTDISDDYDKFIKAVQKCDALGKPLLGHNLKVRTNKNRIKTIEVNTRPIHDSEGKIIKRTGVLRDITKETNLVKKLDEIKDFNKVFLHEIRTPISKFNSAPLVIKRILKNTSLTEEELKKINIRLDDIKIMGERLKFISNAYNFEEFIKISNIQNMSILKDIVKPVINISQEYIVKQYKITIDVDYSMLSGYRVWGDKNLLNIVFNSLIDNASKYTYDKNSSIKITGSHDNKLDYYNIIVKNQGYEILEEERYNIFKKGVRGKGAKEKKIIGTGIGLYLSKTIMEKLHGDLMLTSLTPVIFEMKIPMKNFDEEVTYV